MPDDDDRNSIDYARDISKNWTGDEWSTEGMMEEFSLFSHPKRAGILDNLDREFRNADTSDLKKFSELMRFRRNVQNVHHTLRKAGR